MEIGLKLTRIPRSIIGTSTKYFFYQILMQVFCTPVDSLPGFVFWVKLVQEEALLTCCTFIFYKKITIFVYMRCFF